jgi:hypothetical protein
MSFTVRMAQRATLLVRIALSALLCLPALPQIHPRPGVARQSGLGKSTL